MDACFESIVNLFGGLLTMLTIAGDAHLLGPVVGIGPAFACEAPTVRTGAAQLRGSVLGVGAAFACQAPSRRTGAK